jgi:hypothetical protein
MIARWLGILAIAAAPFFPQHAEAQGGVAGPTAYLYCETVVGPPAQFAPCNTGNPLPISGAITASLGGFTPSASGARGTPVAVTTSDSSGTLPTGVVVVVSNVGANPMYCNVNGIAATTSDQYISSSGGWFAFTIPSGITTLHCIATGGSTTADTLGGAGLATGTGGGGGAGSGGTALADQATFTQGTTSETPMGCLFATSYSAGTSGKGTVVSCTSAGSVHTTVDNTNANGQATMANSSPVVIASNQSNLPTNIAQFGGVSTATGQVAVSTAPVTATNTALVVDLRPDSPGIITLGTALPAASVPVVGTPGFSSSSTVGMTPVIGGSAASSLVLKASAGNLYSVYAECSAACWLMVFNSTTAPSNGSTTAGIGSGNMQECVPIPAGGVGSINYMQGPPEIFTVGMTAAISSTTCATLTLATTGFIHGMVQ